MSDGPIIFESFEQSIPERFQKITSLQSSRIALGSDRWSPTYDEVNTKANAFAVSIAESGAQGDRVAILMRHDTPLLLTLVAILKAGRVVVVLNPSDPPARLRQILDDAEPALLITDVVNQALASEIVPTNCRFTVFAEKSPGNSNGFANLNLKINAGDPAFLIYTSGSTGRPKGVVQTHRNLLHVAHRLTCGMNLTPQDRILLLASPSGAQGVFNTMCALLNGAALHPFPATERGVTGLDQWMQHQQITVYVSSASLFRNFVQTLDQNGERPDVRLVRLGSEGSTARDFEKFKSYFRDDCILLHTLASSEAGHIARFSLRRDDSFTEKRLPVGRAAEGMEILLHDDQGREVAASETGEIVIRSRYLSPGYWRNDSLTSQKFADVGPDGLRIFRSGDLGRFTTEGLLLHAGRRDSQVKIHGYRVELSEVEDAISSHPEVEKIAVCARKHLNDDAQLVAYIVPRNGTDRLAENLRVSLRATLPAHMTPTGFVFLEKFPLTPHGKIDRQALQRIEPPAPAAPLGDAPQTPAEISLAQIWSLALARKSIGRHDNFFDLGGDSLIAAIIAARVFGHFGIELHLRTFIDCPTLSELAAKISAQQKISTANTPSKIAQVPRNVPLPLSFQQEQTWKHVQRHLVTAGIATIARNRRIRGPLDAAALRDCMTYLVRRHEMLRTTFDQIAGRPMQIIHPPEPVPLPLFDFNGAPDVAQQADSLLREDARKAFDLKNGPLIRFQLVRGAPEEHWLLVVSHHLISDAWSWKLYFRELGILYEAKQRGEPPPLPDSLSVQYADYAAWQRKQWQPGSPAFRHALGWWAKYYSASPRPVKSPFARRHWALKSFSPSKKAGRLPSKRLWKHRAAKSSEGWIWWGVAPAVSQRLDQIARHESATFYMARLAAFTALLAAEAGKPDVALGVYLTQRSRLELQEVFGYFVNHAAVRFRCDLNLTFRQWLASVRDLVGEIQAHGEIPFELLRDELRKTGVEPIGFRVYFDVAEHTAPTRFGALEWTRQERIKDTMPLAFGITFDQHNEESRCLAAFDARIYHPARVKDFLNRLKNLLDAVSNEPDRPLSAIITTLNI